MKQADAGVLWFCVGVFILGFCGTGWSAEGVGGEGEVAAGASSVAVSAAAEPEGTTVPADAGADGFTYQKKLAALSSASLDQLRKELQDAESTLGAADVSTANAAAQAAREQAMDRSEEVKALQAQIAQLHEEIEQAIGRDAAVVAAEAAAGRAHMALMDQLNFRSGLLKMIAEKERQGKWVDPEPLAEEKTP